MVTEDRIELEKNAPFEEIGKDWYVHLLECVPPERWCNPYRDGGWFFTGEPHSHDRDTGEAYHYLCFEYAGRYYAGCRSIEIRNGDIEREISKFCFNLDFVGA
jgi:hypothetical protein|nr:MAG TPA: Protein of unknown function (DUF1419) [Siphoviridae sp. ctBxQ4]